MIKQTSTEPSLASWEASFIKIKLTSHEDWFNYYTKYGMKSSWLSEASIFLTQGAYMYLKWFPSSTEIIFFFFSGDEAELPAQHLCSRSWVGLQTGIRGGSAAGAVVTDNLEDVVKQKVRK